MVLNLMGIDVQEEGVFAKDPAKALLAFTAADLWLIIEAIHKMMDTFEWSLADFRHAIGADYKHVVLQNVDLGPGGYGDTQLLGTVLDNTVYLTLDVAENRKRGDLFFKATVVHELAHAWDIRQGFFPSTYMAEGVAKNADHIEAPVSDYARTSPAEDWAESVAAVVYPDAPDFKRGWAHGSYRAGIVIREAKKIKCRCLWPAP
jgi:hypothetical protein